MSKPVIPPLGKGRIQVRLLEENDLPMTLRWRNQDHIRKWFIHPEILSLEQHQAWFRGYLQRDNDYVFIIEETRDFKKPVGQVSLYNIDWEGRLAEFGRLMIGEAQAQGKGLAKEASRLLLVYAFKRLGLTRVVLEVFENNEPALAIYRDCGFREVSEGSGLKKFVLDEKAFGF
jgi:RimJ/RimL family protein N-acetyltransferase